MSIVADLAGLWLENDALYTKLKSIENTCLHIGHNTTAKIIREDLLAHTLNMRDEIESLQTTVSDKFGDEV